MFLVLFLEDLYWQRPRSICSHSKFFTNQRTWCKVGWFCQCYQGFFPFNWKYRFEFLVFPLAEWNSHFPSSSQITCSATFQKGNEHLDTFIIPFKSWLWTWRLETTCSRSQRLSKHPNLKELQTEVCKAEEPMEAWVLIKSAKGCPKFLEMFPGNWLVPFDLQPEFLKILSNGKRPSGSGCNDYWKWQY